ncbi:MAG: cation diffusion facilitator family transporter [Muribaculaceae bacterium]
MDNRQKDIYRVTLIGSAANLALTLLKFLAGWLGHSSAMIADAIHSLSDFITDIVVIAFVKISARPADRIFTYGYGKYETLGTCVIALVLIGVGVNVMVQGTIDTFAHFRGAIIPRPSMLALWAAVLSIAVKEAVYQYTIRAGRHLDSPAMVANAWHHRSDALSSVGTLIGIAGAIFLGDRWRVLDPIAAIVVSVFIMRVGWRLLKTALDELLEKALPAEDEQRILQIVASLPDVCEPHHLRTRHIGNRVAIDMHIRVDGNISLNRAHNLTTQLEHRLRDAFGQNSLISIHTEPIKAPKIN